MAARSSKRPTMNDVAREADVSLKTVSRVVNQVTSVDQDMTDRVLASIRRLGYRRNDVAATLRSGTETRTIALITADIQNSFYAPICAAIATVAREHDFQLITASSEENPDLERSTALDLCQRRVSGLIVVPIGEHHGYLRAEVDLGVPVVFVDRPGVGLDADAVLLDNAGGAAAAVAELVLRGHRRIALVLDKPEIYTMRERRSGAEQELGRLGLTLDPWLIVHRVHTPDDAVRAIAQVADLADPPTAVLCGNNRSLIGVVQEVWRRGSDIEVVGFDDFETSRLLPRPITLVDYDTAAMGRIAAEQVFRRIAGDGSPTKRMLMPSRLVVRGGMTMNRRSQHPAPPREIDSLHDSRGANG